jgi:acetyl-CoA synthetase
VDWFDVIAEGDDSPALWIVADDGTEQKFSFAEMAARSDQVANWLRAGRTDDVFKASDYRISPFELESVLIEHDAVVEAAVVPSPDELRLAVPKAYVVLGAGRGDGQGDLRAVPGASVAVPADPPDRVRRTAEDDLRQDPPGPDARRRAGEARRPGRRAAG